jgi:hypothetical protein
LSQSSTTRSQKAQAPKIEAQKIASMLSAMRIGVSVDGARLSSRATTRYVSQPAEIAVTIRKYVNIEE